MSTTVSDSTQSSSRATVGALDREIAMSTPRELHAEAVVFPRDGKPIDQRPVHLRQQRASARYRADGRPRERGDARS